MRLLGRVTLRHSTHCQLTETYSTMAILHELPGVEITVATMIGETVQDNLQEYEDENIKEEALTTTRYVASVSNARFVIRIRTHHTVEFLGDALAFDTFADGQLVSARLVLAERTGSIVGECIVRGHEDGVVVRPLRFSKLEIGELFDTYTRGATVKLTFPQRMRTRTTPKPDVEHAKHVGAITVKVQHVRRISQPVPGALQAMPNFRSIRRLSGKAVKGRSLSHSVS